MQYGKSRASGQCLGRKTPRLEAIRESILPIHGTTEGIVGDSSRPEQCNSKCFIENNGLTWPVPRCPVSLWAGTRVAVLVKLSGSTIVRFRDPDEYRCRPRHRANDDQRT